MSDERYLTVKDIVALNIAPSEKAFHSFLHRRRRAGYPVTCRHRGKKLLFRRSDIEASMRLEQAPRRRASSAVEAR
jgi:hypothetical protein